MTKPVDSDDTAVLADDGGQAESSPAVMSLDGGQVVRHRITDTVERWMGISSTRTSDEAYLDGVRAFAVLAVVVVHTYQAAGAPGMRLLGLDFSFFPSTLQIGVQLFFVLSGFLLARPWFTARREGKPPPSTAKFWRRRLRRIVPAYYLSLILVLLLFVPAGHIPQEAIEGEIGFWNLGGHLLFLQNYIPLTAGQLNASNLALWSLTIEMTWYLVLPLFVLAFTGRRWRIGVPASIAVATLWVVLANHAFGPVFRALAASVSGDTGAIVGYGVGVPLGEATMRGLEANAFPAYALTFAIGVCLAGMVVTRSGRATSEQPAWWERQSWGMAGFVAGAVLLVATQYWFWTSGQFHSWQQYVTNNAYSVALGLLLYGVTFGPKRLRVPLEWLPLRYIGWVSYGVYLFHLPILNWIKNHFDIKSGTLPGFAALFLVVLAIALIVATLSWLLVERPFLTSRKQQPATDGATSRRRLPSLRVVVSAGLAVAAVGAYIWVTGPGDRSPWTVVAATHHAPGVDIVPVLRPVPGTTLDADASGAVPLSVAATRGTIDPYIANVLSNCAGTDVVGSTFVVAELQYALTATAFACRDSGAARTAVGLLAMWEGQRGLQNASEPGSPIWQFVYEKPSTEQNRPTQIDVRYASGATVVGLVINANSLPMAQERAASSLSIAKEAYPPS